MLNKNKKKANLIKCPHGDGDSPNVLGTNTFSLCLVCIVLQKSLGLPKDVNLFLYTYIFCCAKRKFVY